MCIALIAVEQHRSYPLVVLANRDEFFARPTAPMRIWSTVPTLLAGQDLEKGGTWFGVNQKAELALLTNFREPGVAPPPNALSRGQLVLDFLLRRQSDFEKHLDTQAGRYPGFNILFGTSQQLFHFSNRGPGLTLLEPGIHGLSNALLNTNWPKVERGRRLLRERLDQDRLGWQDLLKILEDTQQPGSERLPKTGLPLEWERALSSIRITGLEEYGSRSATIVLVDRDGSFLVYEKDYADQTVRGFSLCRGIVQPLK